MPLHFPPSYNYSLDNLMKSNYQAYEHVIRLLDRFAENMFNYHGEMAEIYIKHMSHMFETGFLKPIVEDNDTTKVYFQFWSFTNNQYCRVDDLAELDLTILIGMLSYMYSMN